MHQKDTLQLSIQQKQTFAKKEVSDWAALRIFPEYYIIKVNQFNDIAKDTLDEWIYFLKNSEVKDEFKAKGLVEAKEVLDIMRLDKEQQYGYNRYLDYLHLKASEALSLQAEAEEKIRKGEKYKNSVEFAKKLIKRNLTNEEIAEDTGLTHQQIQELRADLNK